MNLAILMEIHPYPHPMALEQGIMTTGVIAPVAPHLPHHAEWRPKMQLPKDHPLKEVALNMVIECSSRW